MRKPIRFLTLGIIINSLLMGCGNNYALEKTPSPVVGNNDLVVATSKDLEAAPTESNTVSEKISGSFVTKYGFTNFGTDGNRFVPGKGYLPEYQPIDLHLNGKPIWVTALSKGEGSLWVVVLEDGRVQAFNYQNGEPVEIQIRPRSLPVGMPPVLILNDNDVSLLENPVPYASILTHPVPVDAGGKNLAFIDTEGNLVLWIDGRKYQLDIDTIPDARILTDGEGRLLCLSDRTSVYDHGILGDAVESAGFTLVDLTKPANTSQHVLLDSPSVIENHAPIWTDLDGDGNREIILTQSNTAEGAKLVVYSEDGNILAAGPPIGKGYRW